MFESLLFQFPILKSPIDDHAVIANYVSPDTGEILYWFATGTSGRFDDMLFRFDRCDSEGMRFCLDGDFPILIPERFGHSTAKIGSTTYSTRITGFHSGADVCSSYAFNLVVENAERRMSYRFNRQRGLTLIEGDFLYEGEWERGLTYALVSGSAITYDDFC